ACSSVAGDRHLDARGRALPNRLLVEADQQGFSLELLNPATDATAKLNWRQRYAQALGEILQQVERQWAQPAGLRRWVQSALVLLADWLPPVVLLAALVQLLLRYFDLWDKGYQVHLADVLLPAVVLLIVLVCLHILITLLLPLRWP